MNIITYIREKFLNKKKEDAEENILSNQYSVQELISMSDFSNYPDPEILNPEGDITILYMDDLHEIMETSMNDLEIIRTKMLDTEEKKKMFSRFKIVKCTGLYAGQIALKYSKNNKIDKAILDLTLGKEPMEFDNGQFLDINGDDVAIELYNQNKDIHIAIFSSHTLNSNNPQYRSYMENFLEHTGDDIMKHYIGRIGNRVQNIAEFLFTDKYKFTI